MNTINKEQFISAMRDRTKKLAVDTIKHYRTLPQTEDARIVGKQVVRSATSVAANYRAVCRARSKKEFFAKISITVEESDETSLWYEILIEADIANNKQSTILLKESNEILAILTSARKTVSED
jgi:four helix bundle protein